VFCASGPTVIIDVTNPSTGRTWKNRNLGASQVALSSTDASAFGDSYQWGRRSDGHQCRTSNTTTTLSSTDTPAHGDFIQAPNPPDDWRNPQNDNLWQGVNGINNPCPTGYRLPTETELNAERLSWSSNNVTGAYASPLKWPGAGTRSTNNGFGYYWSSTINVFRSRILQITSNTNTTMMKDEDRDWGFSVRCIKN
jgi:uncharacterized protein (TIGR02145 family)